jgi:hypothetical protein
LQRHNGVDCPSACQGFGGAAGIVHETPSSPEREFIHSANSGSISNIKVRQSPVRAQVKWVGR